MAHFVRAYASLGLTNITSAREADTVWAGAGPTLLGGAHDGWIYAARVVAYQHGDSAHFRPYVAVTAPPGTPSSNDSEASGRYIGFCAEVGKAAEVHGVAPGEPDGEEKLDVWRRRH